MGVHLDEGEAAISLEASLNNVTKVLEKRNEIVLGGVGSKIANIAGCLPSRSLLDNHVIALNTMGWEVVMAKGGGWSHSHGRHGLLLRDGWLTLLICPVAANCSGAKPLAIHRA